MIWHDLGTVSVQNGSATVDGVGTLFTTSEVQPGQEFILDAGGERPYQITEVVSDTRILIKPAYAGSDKTSQNYQIIPVLGPQRKALLALRTAADTFEEFAAGSIPDGITFSVGEDAMMTIDADGVEINGLARGDAVVSSIFDDDPNKLLRVNSNGRNGHSVLLTSTSNLDEEINEGTYYWDPSSVPQNVPAELDPTGTYSFHIDRRSASVASQRIVRYTNSIANLWEWRRTKTSTGLSAWAVVYNAANALQPCAFSGGRSTGGLINTTSGTGIVGLPAVAGLSSAPWTVTRFADGTQIVRMEVQVNVASVTSQQFNYPDDFGFVAGGDVFVSISHIVTDPHASLETNNIRSIVGFNAHCTIRLKVAGTSVDATVDAEKLRIRCEGRWRA